MIKEKQKFKGCGYGI